MQVRATSHAQFGVPVNSLINAGDAHTYGGELELSAVPTPGLNLGSSVAYLKTGYDTFTATLPANVAGRTTLLGRAFALVPNWQLNLNASYRLPLPTEGSWRIGGDVPILLHGHLQHLSNAGLAPSLRERHLQLHREGRELVGRGIRDQFTQHSEASGRWL